MTELQPFFEIYVNHHPLGGSVVYWGLKRTFCEPPPYHFEVQWAETANGDWEHVVNTTDTYWAVDPIQRVFAKEIESFYRIILTTSKGRYESFAQQAYGVWDKRDWLYARDICRKEWLVLRKMTGSRGYLLKRKIWGLPCPVCLDWDSTEVANGSCPQCYGTGRLGGYWPGYETYFSEPAGDAARKKTLEGDIGMRGDIVLQGRMLAYPHLSTYDVFVDADSGNRYVIGPVQNLAKLKGIPLLNLVELKLAPFSDIVYQVPIQPEPYTPVEEVPPPKPAIPSGDFMPVPFEPTVPPAPEPPPQPAPVPEEIVELHIPVAPLHAIWFQAGQWHLGSTIGEAESALFASLDGIANPFFLSEFNWGITLAPAGSTLKVTWAEQGVDVKSSVLGVTGQYVRAGTYESMFTYLQQEDFNQR